MTADREALAKVIHRAVMDGVVEQRHPDDRQFPTAEWYADRILASEWLAAVKAESAATALEDAANVATYDAECCPCGTRFCREANETTAAWLHERAAAIRSGVMR